MGKNLVQQARGKGGPRYRAPSFRYKGETRLPQKQEGTMCVTDLVRCQGHLAPLAVLEDSNTTLLLQAASGIRVGETIMLGSNADPHSAGSIMCLRDIPDGTFVFNIESHPGDGGKFCRTSGTFARIMGRQDNGVVLLLPSNKQHIFNDRCRAVVGIVAGAGRREKPILKAGKKWHARRSRNKRYPTCSAAAQNAVDHPYGNKRTSRKAKNKPVSRHACAGQKVGTLWSRRTGQRK